MVTVPVPNSSVVLAILAAVVALPSPASAADCPEPTCSETVQRGLRVARAAMGDNPCVHVDWVDALVSPYYEGQVAESEQGGCAIRLVRGLFGDPIRPPAVWCQIIMHEYGHTLETPGAPIHLESGPKIMYAPWTPGLVPACESHTPKIGRLLAPAHARIFRQLRCSSRCKQLRKVVRFRDD